MNKSDEIIALHKQYVMPTYSPGPVLVRGEGTRVWDADGKSYLDFLAGISVLNVGHCHPTVVEAIRKQAGKLMHVSNLYYNENQPRLAEMLSARSLGGKCFFCNSGAEANEALIKLARLWGQPQGKYEVITMKNSFHGRTLATLTATGQDKVQKGFEPLPQGFAYAEFNDLDSIKAALTDKTAAVLIEAIQGEGGIIPADPAFMKGLRELCTEKKILMLCDEVQCGMGRTGHWFGFQAYDVVPDAIAMAKAIAGGMPMGAVVATPELSDVFQPGHHASTFGGTPLACAAALAVIQVIEEENLLHNVSEMGALLKTKLEQLSSKYKVIESVRGMGLMVAIVLNKPAKDLYPRLMKHGLLTLTAGEKAIRFLPPLNITSGDVLEAVHILDETLAEWQKELDTKK
ncbi:MAG: aspartate aminotransferase family protein [Spartobacteria bacterium]|nr:aspartate aminotransferase family protein [Spartobacteria bacterium]